MAVSMETTSKLPSLNQKSRDALNHPQDVYAAPKTHNQNKVGEVSGQIGLCDPNKGGLGLYCKFARGFFFDKDEPLLAKQAFPNHHHQNDKRTAPKCSSWSGLVLVTVRGTPLLKYVHGHRNPNDERRYLSDEGYKRRWMEQGVAKPKIW